MRRPPDVTPELPEFDDVHLDDDGVWHARHASGREISEPTWDELVAAAVAVRVVASWRRAWS